jgi:hypothetical protein
MHPKFAFPLFFAIFVLIINPKTNSLNMKNDQYFPHEVSTRSNSQIINLIEAEGAAGYGFYWALLEYLRAQDHYTGDTRAIKSIARQMKIRIDKATRVLNDYGLFVVENTLFASPMLVEKMRPLERKRAKVCLGNDVSVPEASCNYLVFNDTSFKEEKRKEEKRKEEKTTTSSSSKEDVAVADDDVIKQSWRKLYPVTFRSQETFKLLPHTRQHSLPKTHATPQADRGNTE